ncbi:MAG: hypothetical protein N2C14_33600, partial [Planctomycetales bacterium]
KSKIQVFDLLAHVNNEWSLRYYFTGSTLTLLEYHPSYKGRYLQQIQQFSGGQMIFNQGYGQLGARGDAHFSAAANAMFSVGGNGSFTSGQSFVSHLPSPSAAPIPLLQSDSPGTAVRRDFSDSAFWNAQVRTDNEGKATVSFKLPDSLTNWRVVVTAISSKMHVGQTEGRFRTFKPIMVWPMIPRIFTEGDQVDLYASVHNRTDKPQEIDVLLKVKNGEILSKPAIRVRVPAKGNVPVYWTYRPEESGFAQLLMSVECDAGSDASLKRLPVARMAAEQVVAGSGFCKGEAELTVPDGVNLKDSSLEITLVPTLADDMLQSLDYLVQYPYGCVEQTMSRFLPAIKVAQTLELVNIDKPELRKKLPLVAEAGIKRLLQLQQPDGGWGWHGGSQTHEMMTPYALYGLLEAERAGYEIPNDQAIEKGLNRLQQFVNYNNQNHPADRVYCAYVYAMRRDLPKDFWPFVEKARAKNKLSDYASALALELAVRADKKELAEQLAADLEKRAVKAGSSVYWKTANFSRWGNDRLEITAAVLKALVAYQPDHEMIPGILHFFAVNKHGNRWNSTKATAMILYAMCDYLAAVDHRFGEQRMVTFRVNGGKAHTTALKTGQLFTIKLPGDDARHGRNVIRFDQGAGGSMYRTVFRYWKRGADIPAKEDGLIVSRRFVLMNENGAQVRDLKNGDTVPRGSYISSIVNVRRKDAQGMRYVLVENPKPSTCEILPVTDKRFSQGNTGYALREDKTIGVVYHYEQTNSNFQSLCVLHAELAGEYLIPPAQVELMYDTEVRGHSAGFRLIIGDKPEQTASR